MTQFSNFIYIHNKLHCEQVSLEDLALKHGSPLYVYSYHDLTSQYKELENAFSKVDHLICYSIKANSNAAILKIFFSLGAGADVVSGGELRRALKAGCDPKKIVFSGVGKTSEEIHLALQEGILQFNVEGEQELDNIQRIAKFLDFKAPIAIRVNPDVDPKTHPYISTGLKENKFGISHKKVVQVYKKAMGMSHIDVVGIDCHIGSQILDKQSFTDAMIKLKDIIQKIRAAGCQIQNIDVGGGLGIRYKDEQTLSASDYAEAILDPLKDVPGKILIEPGRFLVGNAGALVTKVIYVKEGEEGKHFTIVDAAFNDFKRPMLYDAYHEINPVVLKEERKKIVTNITGPICETTDFFAHDRTMQPTEQGEYVALMSSGAYGMSMASTYNSRGRPQEILVKDNDFFVIKKADQLEDIILNEVVPEFLKEEF